MNRIMPSVASGRDAAEQHELIIESGRAERHYWLDLWHYRELFQVLAWRDIAVRYKQTVIGAAWALIRPFLTMVVFTIIFGKLASLPSEGGAPYPLMVFAGLLPWTFFSTAVANASNSLVLNSHLVSKIYFPRLIVPASAVVVAGVEFCISFGILAILMAWYRLVPGWQIIFLPFFTALVIAASLGLGTWLTALNIKYRDFGSIIPFVLQLGLYVSPVGFSSKIIPPSWQFVYSLNPMVGIIDGFRWCILGSEAQVGWLPVLTSLAVSTGLVWFGIRRFRQTEKSFADLI